MLAKFNTICTHCYQGISKGEDVIQDPCGIMHRKCFTEFLYNLPVDELRDRAAGKVPNSILNNMTGGK